MSGPARARGRRLAALALAAGTSLLALLAALRVLDAPPAVPAEAGAASPCSNATSPRTEAGKAPAADAPVERREACAANPRARSFDEDIERLVALGLATGAHAAAGREAEARATDAETRAAFAAVLQAHADAAEQSLHALMGAHRAASVDPADAMRQRVWQLVLGAALEVRHARDPAETDALVETMLVAVRSGAPPAAALGTMLVRQPYLRAQHEPAVLGLAADAATPRPLAVELLLTLWRNLQTAGQRAGQDLDSLALLLLDDSHVVHRLAACRRLLADPRWRHLALERARSDPALRRETAVAAAAELAPAEALTALAGLHPGSGRELLGAFVTLGARDVQCLVEAYEERLAADSDPHLRASLLAGAGSLGDPEGIRLAEAAHCHDPDLMVREQAMFVLTAHAPSVHGERVLHTALDDELVLADPSRLGALVLALENLARAGELQALHRVGLRLRATALREADRARLEELLERHLPRGAGG